MQFSGNDAEAKGKVKTKQLYHGGHGDFIIKTDPIVYFSVSSVVHQSRSAERQGMKRRDAAEQAISFRLRPILMSTLTSIFEMLPLLLVPGAGAELYRGLAGVIIGGVFVSTMFTLVLLPSLLRLGEEKFATS